MHRYEPAPLDRSFVERMLEHVRNGQTKAGFGVTLQEDHNGTWGPLGKRYLTVRFSDPENKHDLVQVMMEVVNVSSNEANYAQDIFENEDK